MTRTRSVGRWLVMTSEGRRWLAAPAGAGAPDRARDGKRLFTDSAPATGFTLVDSRVTSNGAVYSALQPAPFQVGRVQVADDRTQSEEPNAPAS
jgi:hypothetical protein